MNEVHRAGDPLGHVAAMKPATSAGMNSSHSRVPLTCGDAAACERCVGKAPFSSVVQCSRFIWAAPPARERSSLFDRGTEPSQSQDGRTRSWQLPSPTDLLNGGGAGSITEVDP